MPTHPQARFARWLLAAAMAPIAFSALAAVPVDFRYAPPEWQTSICLPDDPAKTLVDRSGELLYHYGVGEREFATRVALEVAPDATWQKQELLSPRVPIVRTFQISGDLEIVQEAFASTEVSPARPKTGTEPELMRRDDGEVLRNWAKPAAGMDPSLADIAVHMDGNIQYNVRVPKGGSRLVVLALCEGWWSETGKRIQVLRVEGAEPRTVDTVGDIGQNRAAAFAFNGSDLNQDGQIEVHVDAAPAAADKNTILNGLWVFDPGKPVDTAALLAGNPDRPPRARFQAETAGGQSRSDVVLVRVTNRGRSATTIRPTLVVDTTFPFALDTAAQRVLVDHREAVTASLPMTGLAQTKDSRRTVQLGEVAVPSGRSVEFFAAYGGEGAAARRPATLKQALAERQRTIDFWTGSALPFGRVQVPDPGIQALVDSSIRNIWQAREIKNGLPAFQVGPTCYRGLWIVDGAFLLEAAAILGAGPEARNGVAYELTWQKPDGRIEVMQNFSKENGIVLWTCLRHAQLTQDRAWLESIWPRLERIATYIKTLRQRTLENDSDLDDGLMPPGFPDGGIGGVHAEYTNPYWNLVGLKAFIQGARWLGKTAEAASWQQEYDAFMAAFRGAAERDMARDPFGNTYLPTLMGAAGRNELPQRGQWAFCQAVYPGQLFAKEDPLVTGTLQMLRATEREGMVYGTGWDANGLWNYFASFYAHAWLWQGDGRKAAEVLYAYANHAAPTLVWREEQSLKGERFNKVGDMPHNWASAEFIRLVTHLLALDRGDELHLLEGFPPAWAGPGMTTRLRGIATPFGPLDLTARASKSGRTLDLTIKPLAVNCRAVVVHWPDGTLGRIDPQKGGRLRFDLSRHRPAAAAEPR